MVTDTFEVIRAKTLEVKSVIAAEVMLKKHLAAAQRKAEVATFIVENLGGTIEKLELKAREAAETGRTSTKHEWEVIDSHRTAGESFYAQMLIAGAAQQTEGVLGLRQAMTDYFDEAGFQTSHSDRSFGRTDSISRGTMYGLEISWLSPGELY